jgi:hypothetical protein
MSFFWTNRNYKQKNRLATSLQTYPYSKNPNLVFKKLVKAKKIQLGLKEKRISLFTLKKRASLTVETAIILPIFMIVICNLLSFLIAMRTQEEMMFVMQQTAKEMAVYTYGYEKITDVESGFAKMLVSVTISNLYAKNQVVQIIGAEKLGKSMIQKGGEGISFYRSNVLENHIIDLVATYKCAAPFVITGYEKFKLISRARVRAWTGYSIENKDNTENQRIVYITETGSVYHTNENCSHISLSIEAYNFMELILQKNIVGLHYKKCPDCDDFVSNGNYYTTKWGEYYHTSLNCSYLKRTIIAVPISKVGNRNICQRCKENAHEGE